MADTAHAKNRRKTGKNGKAAVCHLFQNGKDRTEQAFLTGRTAWYISQETGDSGKTTTKYTKVSWFNIENADTEAKLIAGVGVRTDNNSGAVTFAITT